MSKLILIILTCLLISSKSYSATINPGELLISEVMSNPLQVSDINGEWFEIFNASTHSIDLNGITISDDGSNFHVINNSGSLLILPGEYFVMGRNGDSLTNGGYDADYVYSNFTLGNSSDQIILSNNNIEFARLNYSGTAFGEPGVSAELILQSTTPSAADYQLTQNLLYGLGDTGTPGIEGSLALTIAQPVPVPGTIWLFISAIALFIQRTKALSLFTCNKIYPV